MIDKLTPLHKPFPFRLNSVGVNPSDVPTILELLNDYYNKIQECVETSNTALDFLEWLKNEGLEIEVVKQLDIWLNDGTIEDLINIEKLDKLRNELLLLINTNKNNITTLSTDFQTHKNAMQNYINEINSILPNKLETTTFEAYKEKNLIQYENGINMKLFSGTDDTEKLQNALNSNYKTIYIPDVTITRPLKVPHNSGKKLIGIGGLKGSKITVRMTAPNTDVAFLEYAPPTANTHNDAGIVLQDLWIEGWGSTGYGIHLKYTCYPYFRNVIIEGFQGYGLLLDKCQDGSFNNLVIQGCGNELYKALHLRTTWSGDHNNMLRFNDCQIEENRISPYIYIEDTGAIGIWFNDGHFEDRTGNGTKDLCHIMGGDINFNQCAVAPTFKNGIVYKGYGTLSLTNCRELKSVIMDNDGMNANLIINNCSVMDKIHIGSCLGYQNVSNSRINYLEVIYASGTHLYSDNSIGEVKCQYTGASPHVVFMDCIVNKFRSEANTEAINILRGSVKSELNLGSAWGSMVDVDLSGISADKLYIAKEYNIYKKKHFVSYNPEKPIYEKELGSICWNDNPIVGGYIGWVKATDGTWRGFGKIE